MCTQEIKQLIKKKICIPIINHAETQNADKYSIDDLKIPSLLLMENAGKAVCEEALSSSEQLHNEDTSFLFFIGCGNNGADGIVAARHLAGKNKRIYVVQCLGNEAKKSSELKTQINILKNIQRKQKKETLFIFENLNEFLSSSFEPNTLIIIDAIFGAGLNRAPKNDFALAIKKINEFKTKLEKKCFVISVDNPSGVSFKLNKIYKTSVLPDITLTFGYKKTTHLTLDPKNLGRVKCRDIGIFYPHPPIRFLINQKAVLNELLLPISLLSYKNSFGHVLIAQGHENLMGASRISSLSALRVGAGLVTIVSKDSPKIHAADYAEFMKKNITELDSSLLKKISACVVGPGFGQTEEQLNFGKSLINRISPFVENIIVDAEALKLLKGNIKLHNNTLICTPHMGEAAKLLNISVDKVIKDPFSAIQELGKINMNGASQIIWVLKGAMTLVLAPNKNIFVFTGYNPALAAGGSGDSLSGSIAGLIKQSKCALCATMIAISLQIKSAYFLNKDKSKRGFLASEICNYFPYLLRRKF